MTNERQQDRIEKIVVLDAPVARVWRALTDHREFGQWFRVELDGPFEVGKRTTGRVVYPGHEPVAWESTTERLIPEELFAFSWPPSAVDPETAFDPAAKVTVEFRLEPADAGTRLTISESGFSQFPQPKRAEILCSCTGGWDLQAENIAAHLAADA